MKKNLGMMLLAVYLIVVGVLGTFGVHLGTLNILVPLLALAAGVALLANR